MTRGQKAGRLSRSIAGKAHETPGTGFASHSSEMATEPAPAGARIVYALEMGGRSVYCASAGCVHALLSRGWRLSDSGQLMSLVQQLSSGESRPGHDPEDHFR